MDPQHPPQSTANSISHQHHPCITILTQHLASAQQIGKKKMAKKKKIQFNTMVIKHSCFWIFRSILCNIILCACGIYACLCVCMCVLILSAGAGERWAACVSGGWRLALAVFLRCFQHCSSVTGSLTVPGDHSLSGLAGQ